MEPSPKSRTIPPRRIWTIVPTRRFQSSRSSRKQLIWRQSTEATSRWEPLAPKSTFIFSRPWLPRKLGPKNRNYGHKQIQNPYQIRMTRNRTRCTHLKSWLSPWPPHPIKTRAYIKKRTVQSRLWTPHRIKARQLHQYSWASKSVTAIIFSKTTYWKWCKVTLPVQYTTFTSSRSRSHCSSNNSCLQGCK